MESEGIALPAGPRSSRKNWGWARKRGYGEITALACESRSERDLVPKPLDSLEIMGRDRLLARR